MEGFQSSVACLDPSESLQRSPGADQGLISTTQQELTRDVDFNHQIVRTTMQQDIEDQSTCH